MRVTSIIRLKEGERVIGIVRQFPLVFLPQVTAALLLLGTPLFLMLPLFFFRPFGWPVGLAAFWLFLLAGTYQALRVAVIWYWNSFIITSQRVVDVNQGGLFQREVKEACFDKMQDVAYRVKGIGATLFGYGTLVIQTAGATGSLELTYVRHPQDVHHLITGIMDEFRRSGTVGSSGQLMEAAAELSGAEARAFVVGLQQAVQRDENQPVGAAAQALADSDYFGQPQVTEEVESSKDFS